MIAALVSLGFATYEKAEKYGYSERLDAVVNELFIANLTTDVLQDQIADPAPPPPEFLESGQFAEGGLMMATANGNASYDPTELGRLGQAIQLESAKKTPDLQELKRLIAQSAISHGDQKVSVVEIPAETAAESFFERNFPFPNR